MLSNVVSTDAAGNPVATDYYNGSLQIRDPLNLPPISNAGTYDPVILPSLLTLSGTAYDQDARPNGSLFTFWFQLSGPAQAAITDPYNLHTTVSFPVPGTYVIRLSADDSELQAYSEATITVLDTPPPPPQMHLSKSATVATARSGDEFTFTINYENRGGSTATDFVITDVIPAGTTYVNGSIAIPPGATGGYDIPTRTLTWTIPSVAAGGTGSVNFKVRVNG